MPWLIAYVFTSSPLSRVSEPDNVSEPTSEPEVIVRVNNGSDTPYSFDFASAVTVNATLAKVTVVAEDDTAL